MKLIDYDLPQTQELFMNSGRRFMGLRQTMFFLHRLSETNIFPESKKSHFPYRNRIITNLAYLSAPIFLCKMIHHASGPNEGDTH